jgi:tRNA-2-methylthio-N6-dimethylallyladenosine synthase
LAETVITYAAPHHLNADDGLLNLRRTRGGDAWAARRASPDARPTVTLGLPSIGLPAPLPAVGGCQPG